MMRFHTLWRKINFVHAQYFWTPSAYEAVYQRVSASCELICDLPVTDTTYISVYQRTSEICYTLAYTSTIRNSVTAQLSRYDIIVAACCPIVATRY